MKTAVLLYGRDFHYLDHLAPLAALLDIPILTTEEEIYEMALSSYPDVKPLYFDPLEIPILFKEFDQVIYSFTAQHFHNYFSFAQDLTGKKIKTLWCPHGNSDKDNLGALKEEPRLLVYGNKMQEELKKKKVFSPFFTIGNYRLAYYQKNSEFYDKLNVLFSLPQENPTYLYAPTWDDYEKNSSFSSAFLYLLKNLPDSINLIIKPHPNTWLKDPFTIEKDFFPYSKKKNVLLITDFMPIYPLLQKSSAYIGDASSIGYDFLYFNRPMFFISKKESLLLECGHRLDTSLLDPFSWMEQKRKDDPFAETRKKLYDYTFSDVTLCPKSLLQFPG